MSVSGADFDLEDKNLSLIDFGSEDDCLYLSPPRDHPSLGVSDDRKEQRNVQFLEVQVSKDSIDGDQQGIQLFESSDEKKRKKKEKYNLRKSLAWDRAFFTSEGVLEPEELSTMISGVEQGQKRFGLPEIEEEICRSSESICTLATDKSVAGALEDDLFGDIRASIQKSSKACKDNQKAGKIQETLTGIEEDMRRSNDSISTLATDVSTLEPLEDCLFGDVRASIQKSSKASRAISQGKLASGVNARQLIKSSEKVSTVSQNKLMTNAALKKPKVITRGSGKMVNKVSSSPEAPKCGPRTGESVSLLGKPPKITAKANTFSVASTKRASLNANSIKVEKDNAKILTVPGRGTKVPMTGASRCGVPKPVAPVKTSLRSSVSSKTQLTPSSSIDSFESVSSSSSRHSSEIQKSKSSSTSTVRTGSTATRTAPRNSKLPMSSRVSARLNSLTKPSANISPASSISEWSVESLSPTSTLNNKPNKTDGLQASGSKNLSNDSCLSGNSSQVTGMLNSNAKGVSNGSGTLNRPEAKKPSGLRMPSPKIGFFDGAKSMVRTPTGSLKLSTGSCNLPKLGSGIVGPGGGIQEARRDKLQPARTVKATLGTKTGAQKTALEAKPISPLPLQEASNLSPKVTSASRAGKNQSGMPLKVQNKKSPGKDEQYSLNAENIPTKESRTAIGNSNLCDSERSDGPCKDTISSPVKDNSEKVEEIPTVGEGSMATFKSISSTEHEGDLCGQKNDLDMKPKSPSHLHEASDLSSKVCSGSRTGKQSPVLPLEFQNKKSPGKEDPHNLNGESIVAKDSDIWIASPVSCDSGLSNRHCQDELISYGDGNDSEKVEDDPKAKSPLSLNEVSNLSSDVFSGSETEKRSPGMLLKVQSEKSPGKDELCHLNPQNLSTKESDTERSNPDTCSSEKSNSLRKDKTSSHGEGNDSKKVNVSNATSDSSTALVEEDRICSEKTDWSSLSSGNMEEARINDEADRLAQELEALVILGQTQQKSAEKAESSSFNGGKMEEILVNDEVDRLAQELEALVILGQTQQKPAEKNESISFNSSKMEETRINDEVDRLAQELEALVILGQTQQKPGEKNGSSFFDSSKMEETCINDEVDRLAQQFEALVILGEIKPKPAENCSLDQVNISEEVLLGASSHTPTGVKSVDTEI